MCSSCNVIAAEGSSTTLILHRKQRLADLDHHLHGERQARQSVSVHLIPSCLTLPSPAVQQAVIVRGGPARSG